MNKCVFMIALFAFTTIAHAQDTSKKWELHLKLGSQTYLNSLDPDPGSAGLGGLHLGYNISSRSMVGLHSASAGYKITYFDGRTESKSVNSFLLTFRYGFRAEKKLRPYLEGGLGMADPIIGYDTGKKPALSFALGAKYWFASKWSLFLESRGISWMQDDTNDVAEVLFGADGSDISAGSNEFTIGIGRLF